MKTPSALRFTQPARLVPAGISALVVAVALLLGACPCPTAPGIFDTIASRPENAGLRTQAFGREALVTLDQGNLLLTMPATEADRAAALGSFFDEYRDFFGWEEIAKAEALSFAAATPEQQVGRGDTTVERFVFLYQEHEGALVIDGPLVGIFAEPAARAGGELRRVRGHLVAPSGLPSPPAMNETNMVAAERLFTAFLANRKVGAGKRSFFKTPVILGEKGVAGFLATYTEGGPDEVKGVLHAVVDLHSNVVHLYSNIPGCSAHAG